MHDPLLATMKKQIGKSNYTFNSDMLQEKEKYKAEPRITGMGCSVLLIIMMEKFNQSNTKGRP
uniref:Uncharacterized protein n=1 Tax=Rhizophora mucronata TaxID=61149 RepID=A0A2P2PP81_RHIMU